uniref:PHD-type domain-containing protein n=1 Tax=Syphacia muris TaxID=451379 RepID=A0A0N5AND8_9BILA
MAKALPKDAEKGKSKRRQKRSKYLKEPRENDDNEVANFVYQLNSKFRNRTQRQYQDHPACLRKGSNGEYQLCNSERYSAVINRAKDSLTKMCDQNVTHNNYVNGKWRCAFCQQRSLRSVLGDLFGPYYIKVTEDNWPTFLAKKPQRLPKQSEYWFDLWVHGDCALSAPGIHLHGGKLPALEKTILDFWKQHCCVCTKEGATLEFGGKFFHYPCAYQKGNLVNSLVFSSF